MSLAEILTAFTEVANLVNERPIGSLPGSDSVLRILTPNSLLLGRSEAVNPGGFDGAVSLRSRVTLVESVICQFWEQWVQMYVPSLVKQRCWKDGHTSLKVGDVVLVMDGGAFKGNYHLARVTEVFPGPDGRVRKVAVAFKNYKVGEKVHEYRGARDTVVMRSVQRLALITSADV